MGLALPSNPRPLAVYTISVLSFLTVVAVVAAVAVVAVVATCTTVAACARVLLMENISDPIHDILARKEADPENFVLTPEEIVVVLDELPRLLVASSRMARSLAALARLQDEADEIFAQSKNDLLELFPFLGDDQ